MAFLHVDLEKFEDSEVTLGVWEDYWVVAVNAIGPGPPAHVRDVPWWYPYAPQSLKALGLSGRVELNWSPPENNGGLPILGYHVYRGEETNRLDRIASVVNTTRFVDLNVEKDRAYYYAVKAFHARADGFMSSVERAVPFGSPEAPVNLVLEPLDSAVRIEWDKPYEEGGRSVTSYTVYRGESNDSLVPVQTLPASTTVWKDTGLVNGRWYYYMVTATNSAGEGEGTHVFWTVPRGSPGPPTLVYAEPGNSRAVLTWSPPVTDGGSRVLEYDVYRGPTPQTVSWHRSFGVPTGRFVDKDVQNGERVYYAVRARNAIDGGPLSAIVSTVPFGPPTWPRTFEVEPGMEEVVLRWGPPKDDGGYPVLSYHIYRGPTRTVVDTNVTVGGDQLEYHDEDVEVGRIYYYRIIAETRMASSAPSWVLPGSPMGAPTVPRGITVVPLENRTFVTWGTPGHDGGVYLEGYRLYVRALDEEGRWMLVATVLEGTSHTVSGLENGRSYEFRITAFNSLAEGEGVVANVTMVGPPEPPLDLTYRVGDGGVHLRWEPPEFDGGSPVTLYSVMRVDTGGVTYVLAHLRNGTSYVDGFAEPGGRYTYTVTASNEFGEGGPASTEELQVPERMEDPVLGDGGSMVLAIVVVAATSLMVAGYWRWKRRKEYFVRFSS